MSDLTINELIRIELQGKHEATGRYDTIIWKIRAGYVAVVYGLIGFMVGKEMDLSKINLGLILFTLAISAIALILDLMFRICQIRVLKARNQLVDLSVDLAMGQSADAALLKGLLHISGEDPTIQITWTDWKGLAPLFLYYSLTTVLLVFSKLI